MPPKKHARLGASKAKRWMNCPGSVGLSEGIEDVTSSYATEGTAAHNLVERCLNGGVEAMSFLGLEIPADDTHVMATEEMCEAVQTFVDHVMSLVDDPRDEMFLEHQFDLAPLSPPEEMYGTSDVTLWKPQINHLHVLDYKHGVGVAVDAKENEQCMMYALGAVIELRKRPDYITVWIGQPRGFHPAGPIREYTFTFEELKAFKFTLFAAAEATQQPDAPLAVGDWCRFCPALAVCPAQMENATAVAQMDFADMVEGGNEETLPTPDTLDITQLVFVLQAGDVVVDWIKAVHKHAANLLDRGEDVPGFKLIAGRANRRWKDPEKVERFLSRKKLKKDERYNLKLISPAQAEKALKAIGEELPEKWWEKPEGKPKLVPAADARPALSPSAQEDFDIPETENE